MIYLMYGRETEPHAINQYAKVLSSNGHKDVSVSECGLFVLPEHIYMAASQMLLCCAHAVERGSCK